jgi:ribosomal protein S18 acetylase RimI-like enzyme
MYNVKALDNNNIDEIKGLYENFLSRSLVDYKFEVQPLSFEDFKGNFKSGFIKGFYLEEDGTPECLLLYVDVINESIELNLIHCMNEKCLNEKRSEIVKIFTEHVKKNSDKKVISYPMLGIQDTFVQNIAYFGYKFVGQAIVEFNFKNPVCLKILEKSQTAGLSENYTIDSWKDIYFDETAQVIHEQFKNASDSFFDPRFKTLEGSKNIVTNIIENIYGIFLSDATTVLKFNDKICGVCFANMITAIEANIPLVAIKKPHNHKGFGAMLLKHTVNKLKRERERLLSVNATTDTDNYPAMRMYRKVGFKEIHNYPHAYFKLID